MSRMIDPAGLPDRERKLLDREQEIRNRVRVTRADYRVRRLGRWWRIPGRFNVAIPGVMVVGGIRRRKVPRWIEHVVRKALAGHPEEANAAGPALDDQFQLDLATAIARIMQAYKEPAMREFLLWRLYECDVPRLREYLNDESLALLAEVGHG